MPTVGNGQPGSGAMRLGAAAEVVHVHIAYRSGEIFVQAPSTISKLAPLIKGDVQSTAACSISLISPQPLSEIEQGAVDFTSAAVTVSTLFLHVLSRSAGYYAPSAYVASRLLLDVLYAFFVTSQTLICSLLSPQSRLLRPFCLRRLPPAAGRPAAAPAAGCAVHRALLPAGGAQPGTRQSRHLHAGTGQLQLRGGRAGTGRSGRCR